MCFFTNSSNGLSIAKQVIKISIGGSHSVFNELSLLKNYGDADSPGMEFVKLLKEKGINAALKKYQILKETIGLKNIINEGTINTLGYFYMEKRIIKVQLRYLQ